MQCSRLDIALDDYDKYLDPSLMVEAIEANDYAGFRVASFIRNLSNDGFTLYLGSRESEHFVRYYNKSAESNGEVDSYRFESEFKGDKSAHLAKVLSLTSTVQEAYSMLNQMIFGKVNFYDAKRKNLARNQMCEWWTSFVSRITSHVFCINNSRKKTSIESKIAWIRRQVAKSLATIKTCFGVDAYADFLAEVEAIGIDKMRRFDELLILQYEYCNNSA
jgi:DNA relaxase NicK